MSKVKKITLSIGIPAHNEEANIKNLLNNLLKQSNKNYTLLEIIVNSDGSSDNTVANAKSLKNRKIKVLDNKDRQGKIKRVNQIFNMAKGDVVTIIDADVLPTSIDTFCELLKPFVEDPNTSYVSGELTPVKPKNFVEEAIKVSRNVWDQIRPILKDGKSVYTCHGALYALKSAFARQYNFPENIWADIGYHYFVCIKNGHTYYPTPEAAVYFKLPATAKDYIKQINRYQKEDKFMYDYFGQDIASEYKIPDEMLRKFKKQALVHYPLHSLTIFALNFYAKKIYGKVHKSKLSTWTMINSTKEEIKND